MNDQQRPKSFAVGPGRMPYHRRVVFSSSVSLLAERHVDRLPDTVSDIRNRRRRIDDESLRLIDDLTNRSLDPMFSDATLVHDQRGPLQVWMSRLLVFLICLAVGLAGSVIVRELHADPRSKIREKLISQVESETKEYNTMNGQITKLRSQIDSLSAQVGGDSNDPTVDADNLLNGFTKVEGDGISISLADPIAATGAAGSNDTDNDNIRVITDIDLQQFVSRLWASGAEAISINGYRVGVQTSVRTAGTTILVGLNSIQSPYTITAIGDADTLKADMSSSEQKGFYGTLNKAGIHPQLSKEHMITMNSSAGTPDLSYAKRSE
ncbi:DUF881 domain-containing protein [Bifidobacterium aquikefiricola]|uniref:DUF881 domain-containing protein n=1 Tax=Bifidobacterium aquikefiricola TaxID=3059038 RepID=A0AB39U430_9BIFI